MASLGSKELIPSAHGCLFGTIWYMSDSVYVYFIVHYMLSLQIVYTRIVRICRVSYPLISGTLYVL